MDPTVQPFRFPVQVWEDWFKPTCLRLWPTMTVQPVPGNSRARRSVHSTAMVIQWDGWSVEYDTNRGRGHGRLCRGDRSGKG